MQALRAHSWLSDGSLPSKGSSPGAGDTQVKTNSLPPDPRSQHEIWVSWKLSEFLETLGLVGSGRSSWGKKPHLRAWVHWFILFQIATQMEKE